MTHRTLDLDDREHGDEEAEIDRRPLKRRADRLLTIDRALLAGIFAAGAWYASTDLRQGNVIERVAAIERRNEDERDRRGTDAVNHAVEIATIKQRLSEIDRRTENIEKGVGALAESTARLANSVRDPR